MGLAERIAKVQGVTHNHTLSEIGLDGRPYAIRYDRGCGACDAERAAGVVRSPFTRAALAGTLPAKVIR
jgi:hypothetical protein